MFLVNWPSEVVVCPGTNESYSKIDRRLPRHDDHRDIRAVHPCILEDTERLLRREALAEEHQVNALLQDSRDCRRVFDRQHFPCDVAQNSEEVRLLGM